MKFVYYNHSYVSETPEIPVLEKLSFSQIKNAINMTGGGRAFLASYITEFDVNEQTEWYFTIKDSEYDLSILPSKKRYEITKARKFCESRKINPEIFLDELFSVYENSFLGYAEVERPKDINFEDFENYIEDLINQKNHNFYGCFFKETGKLIGFLITENRENVIGLKQQKTMPEYEKYNSNASLLDTFLLDVNEKLKNKEIIISNGSRSIRHQTNFNSYLEKYFGFRKAYAKLRIVYKFPIGIFVKLLRPFKVFLKNTKNPFLYNIYCILKMDSFSSK